MLAGAKGVLFETILGAGGRKTGLVVANSVSGAKFSLRRTIWALQMVGPLVCLLTSCEQTPREACRFAVWPHTVWPERIRTHTHVHLHMFIHTSVHLHIQDAGQAHTEAHKLCSTMESANCAETSCGESGAANCAAEGDAANSAPDDYRQSLAC